MLNLNHLWQRLAQPFTPFALRLTAGRRFEVSHPDFIAVGRGFVMLVDQNNIGHHIDALHLVSIEASEQPQESAA